MAQHARAPERERADAQVDLRHLRRDARTALELAVVAFAPAPLVDRLATAAGLLEALSELPTDSPPVLALVPRVLTQTTNSLDAWQKWQREHLEGKIPRG